MARLSSIGTIIVAAATLVACSGGVTDSPAIDESLASNIPWTRLSGRIAYSSGCGGGGTCIYVIDAGTRTVRVVRRYEDSPIITDVAWSPDGSLIYYAILSFRSASSWVVESVRLDGIVASIASSIATQPAIARDGRIAFVSQSGSSFPRVCIVGGTCLELISLNVHSRPAWSPNGASILVALGESLYELPLQGGPPRAILRASETPVRESFTEPTFTRDGARFAYVRRSSASTIETEIWSAASDGTDARRLIAGGANEQPAWSHDGARILYRIDNRIVLANADGTQPITVIQPTVFLNSVAWAP